MTRNGETDGHEVVVIGGGPGGADRGLRARRRACARVVLEGRPPQSAGIARTEVVQGLPLRHRRPPLLHEGRRRSKRSGARSCGDDSSSRRGSRASTTTGSSSTTRCEPARRSSSLGPVEGSRITRELPPRAPASRSERANVRGVGHEPLRPPTLPDLLQDLHREGLGHALRRASARTGPRSASRGSRSPSRSRRRCSDANARARARCIKTLIDEFQYPRLGPGQMWEAWPTRSRRAAAQVRLGATRRANQPARTARVEQRRRRDGRAQRRCSAAPHFISSMPMRDLVRKLLARAARARLRGGRAAALPRLPHRRPDRRPPRRSSPTTGSTSTTPRSGSAASRTSRTGAPTWCPTREDLPRARILLLRGRRALGHADAELIALGKRELDSSASRAPREVVDGTVRPHAEGLPGLRRDLPRALCSAARLPRAASEPPTRRPQRHAQATTTRTTRC